MDRIHLTTSEWNVLDCLWEKSPQTVMELVAVLREKVGWAKSTTIAQRQELTDEDLRQLRAILAQADKGKRGGKEDA